MKFLRFVIKQMLRTWVRTGSTVVAMALCIFLFCTLQSVLAALHDFIEGRSPNRLITRHAVSFVFFLPLSYAERIQAVPGVKRVAVTSIFGGILPAKKEGKAETDSSIDFTNFFPNAAVDAEPYFAMTPEFIVPPDQFRAFLKDLRGCLIGRKLADKYGWKTGDHFFLESLAPPFRKPDGPFEFVVQGIMDTDLTKYPGTDTNFMFFHFKYLNEGVGGKLGAMMYTVEIADRDRAGEISAAIDALFENSSAQTYTETEKAFLSETISLAGNLAMLLNGIGLAVSFAILLVTANTMSMAVRERRSEIAVLKTLGFSSTKVMGLFLGEAMLIGALGGGLGIGGTVVILRIFHRLPGQAALVGLSSLALSPFVALLGLAAALLLGLIAGFLPAWSAYRAKITEMLRVVQ